MAKKRAKPENDEEVGNEIVLRPLLPVAPFTDEFTPETAPRSGEEFLALVQLERARLPNAVRNAVDLVRPRSLAEIFAPAEDPPKWLSLPEEDIQAILGSFPQYSATRECTAGLPALNDKHAWLRAVYGVDHVAGGVSSAATVSVDGLPDPVAFRLLTFHITWLKAYPQHVQLFASGLRQLLSLVDPRMTAGQQSSMRAIGELLLDGEASPTVEAVVVIIARCFGQADLLRSK